MSEAEFGAPGDEATSGADEIVRTGVAAVDEVLAAVDALGSEPLERHAEVFGIAHEQLRRSLDVTADES